MKTIRIRNEARRDLQRSIKWYRKQDRSAPDRFIAAFADGLRKIERNPDAGFPSERGTRSLILKRFPFRIVFADRGDHVMVVAVAHASRRTSYWFKRLKEE